MNDKRGVSTFLGAIILVLVVVSVGAFISVFLRGMTEESVDKIGGETVKLECGTEVVLKPMVINDVYDVCKDTNTIKTTLINRGSRNIVDMFFQVIGNDDIYTNSSTGYALTSGQSDIFNFTYSTAGLNGVRQVQIIPMIRSADGTTYNCIDRAYSADITQIEDC
ncbi:hypothetical protein GF327_03710 [Candidatus Woesearchaeota archaeon]|nr:hypothetical protein [Candidatus Woesearchaeota archaeon]